MTQIHQIFMSLKKFYFGDSFEVSLVFHTTKTLSNLPSVIISDDKQGITQCKSESRKWTVQMPGAGKTPNRRKYHRKTLTDKYKAILELEKGNKSKTEIAKMFDVPLNTLSGWIKHADSIKDGHGRFGPKRLSLKQGTFKELEQELSKWCRSVLDQNKPLSRPMILEKARALKDQLKLKNCGLSTGWFERFKGRHGITFPKSH